MYKMLLRIKSININITNASEASNKKSARFDDILENEDTEDELPDELSSSEDESFSAEDVEDDESDEEDLGFGLGNNKDFDQLTMEGTEEAIFRKEMDEGTGLLYVAALMRKVRSLVKTVKNSTNILRFVRMKQKELCIDFQLIQDFKIR
jgi:hypothetical protein